MKSLHHFPLNLWQHTVYSDPLEWKDFFVCVCLFVFLGLYPWHMEIPRLGVESKLQLLAYATATPMPDPSGVCNLDHSSLQRQIHLSKARDWTHNRMVPSQICFYWTTTGTPQCNFPSVILYCLIVKMCVMVLNSREFYHIHSQNPLPPSFFFFFFTAGNNHLQIFPYEGLWLIWLFSH